MTLTRLLVCGIVFIPITNWFSMELRPAGQASLFSLMRKVSKRIKTNLKLAASIYFDLVQREF